MLDLRWIPRLEAKRECWRCFIYSVAVDSSCMERHKSLLMGWERKRQWRCKEGENECSQRAVLNNGLYPTHPSNLLSHHPFPAGLREPTPLLPGLAHFRTSPGPAKTHTHSLVFLRGFISHSGSALECVLDCVLKRGISSGLLPFDDISLPLIASIKFASTFAFSSGVDMLQRRSTPASCGWSWKGLCEWTAAQWHAWSCAHV